MRDTFLSFSPPAIGPEEIAEIIDTLRSDWISTGPKTRLFEERFAAYVGAPAALALFSATHAMQVALAASGLRPGDEVITSTMTFCSTVHVIEHAGARPVLVDVEPETLCMDVGAVERAMTPRTRGLLPVHIYGHPCDMDPLLEIAARRELFVLEDAAHALPARYRTRMVGTIGTATAFSFYATKNMTTGEGGMLVGNPELIERARLWSLHGMSRDAHKRYSTDGSWFYEVLVPGFKCNMTDLQASLGIHQLRKLNDFQRRRSEIVVRYQEAFRDLPALEVPTEQPWCESAWHIYPLRLNLERMTIDRSRFIEELKTRRIGASVHFVPVHLQPYYRDKYGFSARDYPVAYANYLRLVSLPLHPRLSDGDVSDVIDAVRTIVLEYRR